MKIAVFGAGAIGGHLAARLAHAGAEVSLVARGPHLLAIRQNGLRLHGAGHDILARLPATDDPHALGPQDLVVCAVKAHGLAVAAEGIAALLKPETPVVFAVNGIPWWYAQQLASRLTPQPLQRLDPNGSLVQRVGAARAIGCVVYSANDVEAPGVVHNHSRVNRFVFGEPAGAVSDRLDAWATTLRNVLGDDVSVTDDIQREIWRKLLQNIASSSVGSLSHTTAQELAADPGLRKIYAQVIEEAARVAAAVGAPVATEIESRLERMSGLPHRSSLQQDLLAGRPVELDAQFTCVQDIARATGVATPLLDTLVALLAARARSRS